MDTSIKEKANNILDELRDDVNSAYYSGLLILIVTLFLGSIIAHYITFGFSYKILICILIIFFYLLLYRMKMISAFKLSAELSNYEADKDKEETKYYSGYLNFLESGVEIKQTRVNYIRNLYMLVFPLFLFLLIEVIKGHFTGKSVIFAILFAYIISLIAWKFYFDEDIEIWDDMRDDIENLKGQIHLQ